MSRLILVACLGKITLGEWHFELQETQSFVQSGIKYREYEVSYRGTQTTKGIAVI